MDATDSVCKVMRELGFKEFEDRFRRSSFAFQKRVDIDDMFTPCALCRVNEKLFVNCYLHDATIGTKEFSTCEFELIATPYEGQSALCESVKIVSYGIEPEDLDVEAATIIIKKLVAAWNAYNSC